MRASAIHEGGREVVQGCSPERWRGVSVRQGADREAYVEDRKERTSNSPGEAGGGGRLRPWVSEYPISIWLIFYIQYPISISWIFDIQM